MFVRNLYFCYYRHQYARLCPQSYDRWVGKGSYASTAIPFRRIGAIRVLFRIISNCAPISTLKYLFFNHKYFKYFCFTRECF